MPEAPAIASLPPETAAAAVAAAKSLQLCSTLCDPIDGSLRGSPYEALPPGILQARTLEWVAVSFSRDLPIQGLSPLAFDILFPSLC